MRKKQRKSLTVKEAWFQVALNLIMKARLSVKLFIGKLVFIQVQNKTNFHMKSFALSLPFIKGFKATRKCPIIIKFGERGFDFFKNY